MSKTHKKTMYFACSKEKERYVLLILRFEPLVKNPETGRPICSIEEKKWLD